MPIIIVTLNVTGKVSLNHLRTWSAMTFALLELHVFVSRSSLIELLQPGVQRGACLGHVTGTASPRFVSLLSPILLALPHVGCFDKETFFI